MNNPFSVRFKMAMKKAGKFLAVIILMSITSHMYYDLVTQLNLAADGKTTELSGNLFSSKSLRIGFHSFIVHAHDFVIHNSFNYCTRAIEFAIYQPVAKFLFLPIPHSSFWHPPQLCIPV
jgi:hypothetical protein